MDPPHVEKSDREAEHTLITASLELEQLDDDLFRSQTTSLWVPSRARGVFGGQVISQALVAATKTVPDMFHCHSLHCYFLQSADASVPILYYVDRVRRGKSFLTRGVKAIQRGKPVFIMLVSFSKVEFGPVAAWPAPPDTKPPQLSEDQADRLQRLADKEKNPDRKAHYVQLKQDRLQGPIQILIADDGTGDGITPAKYWMRARNISKFEAPFQKCILAYISDLNFLNSLNRAIRGNPENKMSGAGMMASLDHALHFYDHEFDCSDWVLFVMESPRVALGRGVVYGLFYNQKGQIIATAVQEGVARPSVPGKVRSQAAPKKIEGEARDSKL